MLSFSSNLFSVYVCVNVCAVIFLSYFQILYLSSHYICLFLCPLLQADRRQCAHGHLVSGEKWAGKRQNKRI